MTLIDHQTWQAAVADLTAGSSVFVAIWAERNADAAIVHLAGRHRGAASVEVLSLATSSLHYPSVGLHHPAAILMERAIQDIHGLTADGLPDTRPWLDHGTWPHSRPVVPYPFKPVTGEGVHQIPVGPVHAGTIEPGHFRFSVNGETIVGLEARLGYTHKGTLDLMRGKAPDQAARLAGRVSGDSTVAYTFAFCRAVEQAMGVDVPPRAASLRGIMAELERLANHFGDFGAICNDSGFPLINAHGGVLRERVLRLAASAFGHRLMMDCIVPGGVAVDLTADSARTMTASLPDLLVQFERLVELYDKTASLQDRVVTAGWLDPLLARRLGCGGYVGRASGQDFDARRDLQYAPYDRLTLAVPCLDAGDVDARVRVRMAEIRQSVALILELLGTLADGELRAVLPDGVAASTGSAVVEGFRGDIFAHARTSEGLIAEVFLRDPSWFFWPALEAAIEGNIVADFPLCNKSFNASYSGCDL
ncbi:MAG: NADH-quinone oxidoreductase subunit C [Acidiphilium sp.]|nr:NADH-quinone oxidoreductase subunit C [Acidiphilium sp.]MDD4935067.1 NADH-quinone oxidoreductase subunit C [Acidiphilium sp.]